MIFDRQEGVNDKNIYNGFLHGMEVGALRMGGESIPLACWPRLPSWLRIRLKLRVGLVMVGVVWAELLGVDDDDTLDAAPFLLLFSAVAWLAAAVILLLASSARLRL